MTKKSLLILNKFISKSVNKYLSETEKKMDIGATLRVLCGTSKALLNIDLSNMPMSLSFSTLNAITANQIIKNLQDKNINAKQSSIDKKLIGIRDEVLKTLFTTSKYIRYY